MRGWLNPAGMFIPISDNADHGKSADRLLSRYYSLWKWEDDPRFNDAGACFASWALLYKGWVQLVDSTTLSVWELTPKVTSRLLQWFDSHAHNDRLLIFEHNTNRNTTTTVGKFIEEHS